jgi:hypothetical protein
MSGSLLSDGKVSTDRSIDITPSKTMSSNTSESQMYHTVNDVVVDVSDSSNSSEKFWALPAEGDEVYNSLNRYRCAPVLETHHQPCV